MTWWLWVRSHVEATFLSGVFSPLPSAEACEKSSRWPGNTCVTDRHDMTLAVKVAFNSNTTNQQLTRLIFGMKAYLTNIHLLVPRSRSSAKVKVKYTGYISQEMAISEAFMFHKHDLVQLEFILLSRVYLISLIVICVKRHCGKRRKCWLPTFSSGRVNQGLFRKGSKQWLNFK